METLKEDGPGAISMFSLDFTITVNKSKPSLSLESIQPYLKTWQYLLDIL